jgi:hypothetical protein
MYCWPASSFLHSPSPSLLGFCRFFKAASLEDFPINRFSSFAWLTDSSGVFSADEAVAAMSEFWSFFRTTEFAKPL